MGFLLGTHIVMLCVGCSSYVDVMSEISHTPIVNLKGDDELKKYHQDVSICRQQAIKLNENRNDKRNEDRDFGECLINKG